MAKVYKRVAGGKLEKVIAYHKTVGDRMDAIMFEAYAKATETLHQHRHEGHAYIDMEQGDLDRYLILVDTADEAADKNPLVHNLNTAMSIEYGRAAGSKEITVRDDLTGELRQKTVSWGATEPLWVLHGAFGTKGKSKKVKVKG